MSEKNTCILLYPNYQDVWQAIRTLQVQNFNLQTLSIAGSAISEEEHVAGIYMEDNGCIHFRGAQAVFWENLLQLFNGELSLALSGQGALVIVGAIVRLLRQEQDDLDFHSCLNAFDVVLFNMGIPGDSISQYKTAISAGNILLIVNARRKEVERSCEILHSETQQATVHLA